eukprot:14288976-Alexandrium_andersonii.AAC.1
MSDIQCQAAGYQCQPIPTTRAEQALVEFGQRMSVKHTVGSKSSVVYSGLVAFAGVDSATKGDKKKKARRRAAAADGDRDDEVSLA